MISFALNEDLFYAMEQARQQAMEDRSRFIRVAIIDRLKLLGFEVDEHWETPPERTNRGQGKRTSKETSSLYLNEIAPDYEAQMRAGVAEVAGKVMAEQAAKEKKSKGGKH